MRVFFVASYAESLVNFRGPLLRELVSRGCHVFAAAPGCELSSNHRSILSSMGVQFFDLNLERGGINPFSDFLSLIRICHLILQIRPHVVVAYTAKPVIYSGFAIGLLRLLMIRRRIRYISMITGLGYAFTSDISLKFSRRLLRMFMSFLYKIGLLPSTAVVFQNPDDLATFRDLRLIPSTAESIRVWGSGVDLESFPPCCLPAEPVFLMLARLLADKGIREYVNAARYVKKIYPYVTFKLAGMFDSNPTAIAKSELESWTRDGVIEYLGALQQVQPVLAECRFFVLPSYREGTPRSVLEALSTARPVITTDVPGCRETVVHGVNGLLVPPRDSEALADAMIKLIEQTNAQTQHMANASLILARKHFDVHKVNSQLIKILGI